MGMAQFKLLAATSARTARSRSAIARTSHNAVIFSREGSARRTASAERCGSSVGISGKRSIVNLGRLFQSFAPRKCCTTQATSFPDARRRSLQAQGVQRLICERSAQPRCGGRGQVRAFLSRPRGRARAQRHLFDRTGEPSTRPWSAQPMTISVSTRTFLSSCRTRTGALLRVASVGGNLAFARHAQPARFVAATSRGTSSSRVPSLSGCKHASEPCRISPKTLRSLSPRSCLNAMMR